MRFALIYNPRSGRHHHLRAALVNSIVEILRSAGEVSLLATTSAGDAMNQARTALADGCDRIISAGGDGTAHEILQVLVESQSRAALGILPLGTGNVLATDLGLAGDPVAAARALLGFQSQRLSAGRIECLDPLRQRLISRYFTVAAGVGAHARLIYDASAAAKVHGGLATYYYTGFRSLLTHDFVPMEARITAPDGTVSAHEVVEVVAMRVSSFGGPLKRWRPGGELRLNELRLILLTRADRLALLRYSLAAFAGSHRESAGIKFASAIRVHCSAVDPTIGPIRAQADGEMLGVTPITISIVPDAFSLLMPSQ